MSPEEFYIELEFERADKGSDCDDTWNPWRGIPRLLTEREVLSERQAKVLKWRRAGETMVHIGKRWGISPVRVQQIYQSAVCKRQSSQHESALLRWTGSEPSEERK